MLNDQNPTIGRIVRYVMPNGKIRPAIITTVWGRTTVNLHVFDESADAADMPRHMRLPSSVALDENKGPNTWHWPERS